MLGIPVCTPSPPPFPQALKKEGLIFSLPAADPTRKEVYYPVDQRLQLQVDAEVQVGPAEAPAGWGSARLLHPSCMLSPCAAACPLEQELWRYVTERLPEDEDDVQEELKKIGGQLHSVAPAAQFSREPLPGSADARRLQ